VGGALNDHRQQFGVDLISTDLEFNDLMMTIEQRIIDPQPHIGLLH